MCNQSHSRSSRVIGKSNLSSLDLNTTEELRQFSDVASPWSLRGWELKNHLLSVVLAGGIHGGHVINDVAKLLVLLQELEKFIRVFGVGKLRIIGFYVLHNPCEHYHLVTEHIDGHKNVLLEVVGPLLVLSEQSLELELVKNLHGLDRLLIGVVFL